MKKKLSITVMLLSVLFLLPTWVKAACNSDHTLPSDEWHLISLPCNPGNDNTLGKVFGDDISGELNVDWAVFKFDARAQKYVSLKKADKVKQGEGYWIIHSDPADGNSVKLDLPASSISTKVTSCSSGKKCFDIPLQSRQNKALWNMVGYPFIKNQAWNTSQIVTNNSCNSSACTVNQASSNDKNILDSQVWRYQPGNGYIAVKDSGKLTAWSGFWAKTLEKAHAEGQPKLLIPTPDSVAAPTDPSPSNPGSELLMFDWNTVITKRNHGFPRDKPPKQAANGNWKSPINYANGTLYLRAKITNGGQPISQTMRFNYCVWQKDLVSGNNFGLEACVHLSQPLQGNVGNTITWSQKISSMAQISSAPLDWTRARFAYGVAIKNTAQDPVSDYKNWNWNGENPDAWYPLYMRFTVVVVPNGQTFSGWGNY